MLSIATADVFVVHRAGRPPPVPRTTMQPQYSQTVGDLMSAMENSTLTMQQIAEAFAALTDEELEQLGHLLRARHGEPFLPGKSSD
jgi:hypothetical protein